DGSSSYFNSLQSCCFDADGSRLASICSDGRAHVWDLRAAPQIPAVTLTFQGCGADLAFSPLDSSLLITASSAVVSLWDLRIPNQPLPSDSSSSYFSSSFSATSTSPSMPAPFHSLWSRARPESSAPTLQPTYQSDSQSTFQTTSQPTWIRSLWMGASRSSRAQPTPPSTTAATLVPARTPLASLPCYDPDAATPFSSRTQARGQFTGHLAPKAVYSLLPSRSGKLLVTSGTDNAHKLWSLDSCSGIASFTEASLQTLPRPFLTADESLLLSGSDTGTVHGWRLSDCPASGGSVKPALSMDGIHRFPVTCLASDPANSVILSADTLGNVCGLCL
ncbi:MAG: WD40 repeat domain-containing protein, partial [archaeon]|nr:WD40 repeat domain-containing protein [archaeon]